MKLRSRLQTNLNRKVKKKSSSKEKPKFLKMPKTHQPHVMKLVNVIIDDLTKQNNSDHNLENNQIQQANEDIKTDQIKQTSNTESKSIDVDEAVDVFLEKASTDKKNNPEFKNLVKKMFNQMNQLTEDDLNAFKMNPKDKIKDPNVINIMDTIDQLDAYGLNSGPKEGEQIALWQGDPARVYIEEGKINTDYKKEINRDSQLDQMGSTHKYISDSKLKFQQALFDSGRTLTEKYKETGEKDTYKNFLDKAQGFASCYLAKKSANQDTVRVYMSNNSIDANRYFFKEELPTLRNEKPTIINANGEVTQNINVEYYVKDGDSFKKTSYDELEIATNRLSKKAEFNPNDQNEFLQKLMDLNPVPDFTKLNIPIAIKDSVYTLQDVSLNENKSEITLTLNSDKNKNEKVTFEKNKDGTFNLPSMTSKETSQVFATYTQQELPDHLADEQYTRTQMNLYNKIKPTNEETTITTKTLKKTASQFRSFKKRFDPGIEIQRSEVAEVIQDDLKEMSDKRKVKRRSKEAENKKQFKIHQIFNSTTEKNKEINN